MRVDGLDFHDCEDCDLDPHRLDTPQAFLRAFRAAAHAMCNGDIPTEYTLRLALLLSTMAKLGISSEQAMAQAVANASDEERRRLFERGNHVMAAMTAAATRWAAAAFEDSNNLAQCGD